MIIRNIKFQKKNVILLEKIQEILKEYQEQYIKVTLRQLYYQLVARDIIPNEQKEYSKLSKVLTNARYAGVISWDAIEDRVRVPKIPNVFESIGDLMQTAILSYELNRWKGQAYYIELWTEKDALSSVIEPLTKKYQIALSVNRGYSSASAMYEAAKRIKKDKKNVIFYLGDHDPSGLDMDRDIQFRLNEFGADVKVIRIGLTQEQIKEYSPPPNPAKITDPRAKKYVEEFGNKSWEVDALRPEILQELIEDSILQYLDIEKFEQVKNQEQEDIKILEGKGNER